MFTEDRFSDKYWNGGTKFIEIVRKHVNDNGLVKYPCMNCVNGLIKTINVLEAQIIDRRFNPMYTKQIFHGEDEPYECNENVIHDDIDKMYEELNNIVQHSAYVDKDSSTPPQSEYQAGQFDELSTELEVKLWPGCTNFSLLNFLVKLMHIKVMNKWMNSSFD